MTSPEQSLKITDEIYIVLRSWRRIIIFAIIGALLLGGFALYRYRHTLTGNSPAPAPEIMFTDKEIQDITKDVFTNDLIAMRHNKRIDTLNRRVGFLIDRIDNSVYLAIDENAQPISSFEITVIPEDLSEVAEDTLEQRRYFLGINYLKYAKSSDFYNYLATSLRGRIDAGWLQELVECKLISDDTLHVEVTAPDDETVTILSQAAQDFFLYEIREKLDIEYLYQTEILNLQSRTVKNPDIRIEQENLQKELDEAMNLILEEQAEVDSILNDALEKEKAAIQAEQSALNPAKSAKQTVAMFALAGFFIGVMAAVFWAIYQSTLLDSIYYPDEFAEQLGFLYIGVIVAPEEISSKSFGSGIDRWLERRFWGRRKGQTTAHMSAPYIASVIKGLLGRDAEPCASDDLADTTSFTVAVLEDGAESVSRTLVDAISVQAENNADEIKYQLVGVAVDLDTEDGVKALQSSDAAVILVRPRETNIPRTMRDLNIAKGMGKQVLGIVSAERAL